MDTPTPTPTDTDLPPAAAQLVAMAKESLPHHFEPTPGSFVAPHGYALAADGTVHVFAMPTMREDEIRYMFKRELPRLEAAAVVHVAEAWSAGSNAPEEAALIRQLTAEGRLSEAPANLRREIINVWVETPDIPVRAEELLINVAPDGTRSLATDWTPKLLAYPRPTFRRYYPEGGR